MIARPKISRNEEKTTEIGAFEVGNFAPFCCPGDGGRRLLAYVVCGLVHVGAASSRRGSLDAYGDDDDADWADAVMLSAESAAGLYPEEAVTMQRRVISRVEADGLYRARQGSNRVIQRRFNVSVPRARVLDTAATLRERSER